MTVRLSPNLKIKSVVKIYTQANDQFCLAFDDLGQVVETATIFDDYGLVTSAPTEFCDLGRITEPAPL